MPFGEVVEGMDVADALNSEYGETSGGGIRAGKQQPLFDGGNAYLDRDFHGSIDLSREGDAMNLQDLQTLLDYHYWARDRLLEAIEPLTPEQYTPRSRQQLQIHSRNGHAHLRRRMGVALAVAGRIADGVAAGRSVPGCRGDPRRPGPRTKRRCAPFLDDLGDDGVRACSIQAAQRAGGRVAVWQMLQHVVNHASYHRGQVTTMLRQLGAEPAKSMDMIAFYRVKASV